MLLFIFSTPLRSARAQHGRKLARLAQSKQPTTKRHASEDFGASPFKPRVQYHAAHICRRGRRGHLQHAPFIAVPPPLHRIRGKQRVSGWALGVTLQDGQDGQAGRHPTLPTPQSRATTRDGRGRARWKHEWGHFLIHHVGRDRAATIVHRRQVAIDHAWWPGTRAGGHVLQNSVHTVLAAYEDAVVAAAGELGLVFEPADQIADPIPATLASALPAHADA